MKTLCRLAAILALMGGDSPAGVSVSPSAIFLDASKQSGRVVVSNSAAQAMEFTVLMRFGYPVTDTAGRMVFRFIENTDGEPSAMPWVRVYPERFMLEAGESRVVVFHANPAEGLAAGEYWANPVIAGTPVAAEDGGAVALVLSLKYRCGNVATGVELGEVVSESMGDVLRFTIPLRRTGNAAFLGNLLCRLYDTQGSLVRDHLEPIAVYHTLHRTIEFATSDFPAGVHSGFVEVNTDRQGDAPGDFLSAAPVSRTITIIVPSERRIGQAGVKSDQPKEQPFRSPEDLERRVDQLEKLLWQLTQERASTDVAKRR